MLFFADALRLAAFALRVRAAFFAASERFRDPPPARSLIESAAAESSSATRLAIDDFFGPLSGSAWETILATFFLIPLARSRP